MKKVVLFLFLLSFSLIQLSCSTENGISSVSLNEDASTRPEQNIPVKAISIPSNNIKLGYNAGSVLEYNIGAQVVPDNATMPELLYSSSNEKVLTVKEDGTVTVKDLGQAEVTVTSKSNSNIKQKINFEIVEKAVTALDNNSKDTFFCFIRHYPVWNK